MIRTHTRHFSQFPIFQRNPQICGLIAEIWEPVSRFPLATLVRNMQWRQYFSQFIREVHFRSWKNSLIRVLVRHKGQEAGDLTPYAPWRANFRASMEGEQTRSSRERI
jgi:hypothetical protein